MTEYHYGVILIDNDNEVLMSLGGAGWMSLGWPAAEKYSLPDALVILESRPRPDLIGWEDRYQVQKETL
jgi:hypothetical protein